MYTDDLLAEIERNEILKDLTDARTAMLYCLFHNRIEPGTEQDVIKQLAEVCAELDRYRGMIC